MNLKCFHSVLIHYEVNLQYFSGDIVRDVISRCLSKRMRAEFTNFVRAKGFMDDTAQYLPRLLAWVNDNNNPNTSPNADYMSKVNELYTSICNSEIKLGDVVVSYEPVNDDDVWVDGVSGVEEVCVVKGDRSDGCKPSSIDIETTVRVSDVVTSKSRHR